MSYEISECFYLFLKFLNVSIKNIKKQIGLPIIPKNIIVPHMCPHIFQKFLHFSKTFPTFPNMFPKISQKSPEKCQNVRF